MNWIRKHFITLCVVGFIGLYGLGASLVSLHRYWQYNAFWYDFGIFDTTIWKLSRLHLPTVAQLAPPVGKIVWADHLNPSAIFLAPIYFLSDKAEIMFIAQVLAVSLSALVAYRISLRFVKNSLVRLALIGSYLGFVGMQNALYTDVHNIVFTLLPFMGVLWALYEKKWRLYWVFLAITVGFQESMAAVATMLGVFLLLRKDRNIKMGLCTVVFGIVYGFVAMKIAIPFLNGGYYAYQPDVPHVWYEWVTRFIFPADLKFRTIVLTLATFGFLPIATFSTLPLFIEHFFERFVLNAAATRWDLGFHYNALLSPVMFLAVVEFIIHFQKKKIAGRILPLWAFGTLCMVFILHRFILHGPLLLATHPAFYQQTKTMKFLDNFVNEIPPTGLLMTQNNIAAHFTHRETILLRLGYEIIHPDVIALDIRPGQNANDFFPLSESDTKKLLNLLFLDSRYKKTQIGENQFIFLKK